MTTDTHILELLPAYTLGCLDQDEQMLVTQHLAACPPCRAELRSYQELTAQLALAAPEAAPSPHLQPRLMARLKKSNTTQTSPNQASWWQCWLNFGPERGFAWGIIAAILLLGLIISTLWLWQRVNRLETAARPGGMRFIPLLGTAAAPGASGYVIMGDDGLNGAFVVDDLPLLTEAQQYQLWLIEDGHRVSGAVFSVGEDGYGGGRIVAPQSLFAYATFEVSIEPAGGSPAPTGKQMLSGHIE